jgi:hypothetical protein
VKYDFECVYANNTAVVEDSSSIKEVGHYLFADGTTAISFFVCVQNISSMKRKDAGGSQEETLSKKAKKGDAE